MDLSSECDDAEIAAITSTKVTSTPTHHSRDSTPALSNSCDMSDAETDVNDWSQDDPIDQRESSQGRHDPSIFTEADAPFHRLQSPLFFPSPQPSPLPASSNKNNNQNKIVKLEFLYKQRVKFGEIMSTLPLGKF